MSRLTFREKAGAVCWQKQLRDRYLTEGVPPVPHLDLKRAIVRPVTRATAEQVILKYEWLGTMANTSIHFGLFFGPYCAGVTCIGRSSTGGAYIPRTFGLSSSDVLYLARGACMHWAPAGANSRLIAWSVRILMRSRAGKLLIAYSDTDAGEIGTVYQASNWIYIGRGTSTHDWVSPAGRVMNQMLPRDLARSHSSDRHACMARLRSAGWHEQVSNRKHRYVYILDPSDAVLVARVASMRQPYPKRERSRENAAAGPPAEGGVIPTRSLHSDTADA